MANKKTRAVTNEEYELILKTILEGFVDGQGKKILPNKRVAMALVIEANLGIRVGDAVGLKLKDILHISGRYKLNIVETKTKKCREFSVPNEVYIYIQNYALDMGIKKDQRIVELTERQVQRHLKQTVDYLELKDISTHSFRKYFATAIYNENDYNIDLVRHLLQHSSVLVTQRYLGLDSKIVEEALSKHIKLPA